VRRTSASGVSVATPRKPLIAATSVCVIGMARRAASARITRSIVAGIGLGNNAAVSIVNPLSVRLPNRPASSQRRSVVPVVTQKLRLSGNPSGVGHCHIEWPSRFRWSLIVRVAGWSLVFENVGSILAPVARTIDTSSSNGVFTLGYWLVMNSVLVRMWRSTGTTLVSLAR